MSVATFTSPRHGKTADDIRVSAAAVNVALEKEVAKAMKREKATRKAIKRLIDNEERRSTAVLGDKRRALIATVTSLAVTTSAHAALVAHATQQLTDSLVDLESSEVQPHPSVHRVVRRQIRFY